MQNPQPAESPGQEPDFVHYDASKMRQRDQYRLLLGVVVPRPIALVTTVGPAGPNAAPFSFFNAIGVKPPMVMLSVGPRDGEAKDTARNLRAHPEFVVHIVDQATRERMNICGIEFPHHVNEIERAGFHTRPSVKVAPPRLVECPVQLECVVADMREIGRLPYTLIIGEVLHFHCRRGLVDEQFAVDVRSLDPIARLGGDGYLGLGGIFPMPRLPLPEE